jgi:hypothetical protein
MGNEPEKPEAGDARSETEAPKLSDRAFGYLA